MFRFLKNAGLWFRLLTKRFLKKYTFILLLIMVPLLTLGMRLGSESGSSLMNVLLVAEDQNDETTSLIIQKLTDINGIVHYETAKTTDSAIQAVQDGTVDAAWIFPASFEQSIQDFYDGNLEHLITVYEREENVETQIIREQLYGAMYPYLSYGLALNSLKNNTRFKDMDPDSIADELQEYFDDEYSDANMFDYQYMDGTDANTSSSLMTLPLRGILAIFLLVCAIAAAMFYLQDEKEGLFSWMPLHNRHIFPWAYVFTGTFLPACATFIALALSGTFTNGIREFLMMVVYFLACVSFAVLCGKLFRSAGKLGIFLPILVLLSILICPVFFSLKIFPLLQWMHPSYYYLNSLHSNRFLIRLGLYAIITGMTGIILP